MTVILEYNMNLLCMVDELYEARVLIGLRLPGLVKKSYLPEGRSHRERKSRLEKRRHPEQGHEGRTHAVVSSNWRRRHNKLVASEKSRRERSCMCVKKS